MSAITAANVVTSDKKSKAPFTLIPRWLTADVFFLLILLVLTASVVCSLLQHIRSIPLEAQYIPRDAGGIAFTGPIDLLWKGFETEFESVVGKKVVSGSQQEQPGLKQILKNLQSSLADKGITINTLSDLPRNGIDSSRGVCFGFHDSAFAVVVPIVSRAQFLHTLQCYLAKQPEQRALPGGDSSIPSFAVGNLFVAFPEARTAVASNNLAFLGRSIGSHTANLEYFRHNDELYDFLRRSIGRPIQSGANVFVFIRSDWLPGIVDSGVGLRFADDGVRINARLAVNNRAQLLSYIVENPPPTVPWPKALPPNLAATFAIHDRSLGPIMEILGPVGARDLLHDFYGGLLWSLRQSADLTHMVVSITGYHSGLPQVLTGLWGNPKVIRSELERIRIQFRRERDIEILNAEAALREDKSTPQTIGLAPEAHSTFARYHTKTNGTFDGTPTAEDFDNDTYRFQMDGSRVDFIAPRPTENDQRFRDAFKQLSASGLADNKDLDRYRMAYVVRNDVVWIATDVEDLRSLLRRNVSDATADYHFDEATRSWNARDKVEIFVNLDQTTKLGLLSPESQIEELVKTWLLDLRDHSVLTASLRNCDGRRDCLAISIQLMAKKSVNK